MASNDTIRVNSPYGKGSTLNPIHNAHQIKWETMNQGFAAISETISENSSDLTLIFLNVFLIYHTSVILSI
jgi:hypothetical protein